MICLRCGKEMDTLRCRFCGYDISNEDFFLFETDAYTEPGTLYAIERYVLGIIHKSRTDVLEMYRYKPLAEEGDSDAQFKVGELFEHGWGGATRDIDEAIKWYTKAAVQGNRRAQFKLGWIYRNNQIFRRASALGESEIDQDDSKKAIVWLKKAADQGDKVAMEMLAEMYYEGEGTEKNLEEAIKLIMPSAKEGKQSAIELFKAIYYEKNLEAIVGRLAAKLSEDQFSTYTSIKELDNRIEWLTNNNTEAKGIIEFEKEIIQDKTRDITTSLLSSQNLEMYRYKPLAEEGDSDAQFKVGELFEHGWGGATRDIDEAIKWYTKAAIQGNRRAQFKLGWIYRNNQIFRRASALGESEIDQDDSKKAIVWLKKAADQGDKVAMEMLAEMYYEGEGTEKNLEEAIKLIMPSAKEGKQSAIELMEKVCGEYLMDKMMGRLFSCLSNSMIIEYKALKCPEDRADWIKENIAGYESIVKDEWARMQDEYSITDIISEVPFRL